MIPNVPLKNTTDKLTIANGNVYSLLVFNTNKISDVVPGYYYWDQEKWVRIITSEELRNIKINNTTNRQLKTDQGNLVLLDSDLNKVEIPLTDINIPTKLISNGNGSYTFISENGTITNIDVVEDVINNFEDIISNTEV